MAIKNYNRTPKDKKNIVIKAVVFPVVSGLIIAGITVCLLFGDSFFEIPNGISVANFDDTATQVTTQQLNGEVGE